MTAKSSYRRPQPFPDGPALAPSEGLGAIARSMWLSSSLPFMDRQQNRPGAVESRSVMADWANRDQQDRPPAALK
jgi:hypothetical protein